MYSSSDMRGSISALSTAVKPHNIPYLADSNSSYFQQSMSESKFLPLSLSCNYPSRDPVFHIPKVPELTKVPDPKPPKKAPLAGYDMRTLRKQIDFLQGEIEDRTVTQELLYKQNEELWGYSRSLLECNKTNALLMKGQVKSLHDELRGLHQERLILASKLESAENSKELLLQMGVELSNARGEATDVQQLAMHAEDALKSIREENEELEYSLTDQVSRMRDVHSQLDGLRERYCTHGIRFYTCLLKDIFAPKGHLSRKREHLFSY